MGKLTLSAAASSVGVFQGEDWVFGLLPPAPEYIHSAIVAIASACISARLPCKIGMIEQSTIENSKIPNSFGIDTCAGAQAYLNNTWCHLHLPTTNANHSFLSCLVDADPASADYGSAVSIGVDGSANDTVVQGELEALKDVGANVILGCVFDKIGLQMIKGMEVLDWAPYATAMTTTVTTSTYANMIQDKNYWQGEYIVGVTPWYQSRNGTGAISKWNSSHFYAQYAERYNTGVTEEGAAMFAAAIALVHAIEEANSTDTGLVTDQLQAMDLEEFFGTIKFNTNGQGTAENLVVQYGPGSAGSATATAAILDQAYSNDSLVNKTRFPMPSWSKRRCRAYGGGNSGGSGMSLVTVECAGHGSCNDDGSCTCIAGFTGQNCEEAVPDHSEVITIASAIIGSLAFVICGLYGYILRRRYVRNHTAHDFSNEFEDLVKAGVVQGDANGATTEKIEPKEISRARIQTLETLGEGEFGLVTKALMDTPKGKILVAVKELKGEASEQDRVSLLKEAMVTAQFRHKNVVMLMGVVTKGTPILCVLSFNDGGAVRGYLKQKKEEITATPIADRSPDDPRLTQAPFSELTLYVLQTARGLEYLATKHFIHRDVAARNLLLHTEPDGSHTVKISDFGMTRFQTSSYYKVTDTSDRVPIRWTAIEALTDQKFSRRLGVWRHLHRDIHSRKAAVPRVDELVRGGNGSRERVSAATARALPRVRVSADCIPYLRARRCHAALFPPDPGVAGRLCASESRSDLGARRRPAHSD